MIRYDGRSQKGEDQIMSPNSGFNAATIIIILLLLVLIYCCFFRHVLTG
jgi:hypothetical protein